MQQKIIPYQKLKLIREENLRKKIVLCHGVFDLIHPGHLLHLKEAKSLGDILVVTITAGKYINKKRTVFFNEKLRADLIASLDLVDYVSIINESSAITPIKLLRPDYHVKGSEFKKLLHGSRKYNIHKEKALLDSYGGKLYFTQNQIISPIKAGHLLASASEAIEEDPFYSKRDFSFLDLSSAGYRIRDIEEFIKKAGKLRICVIGETIIDRWVKARLHGPSHKSSALSGKTVSSVDQIGGAGIIALHTANFVKRVDFFTNYAEKFPEISKLPVNLKIHKIAEGDIITSRFVNEENSATLYVNHIRDIKPILKNLPKSFKNYDAVFIADFGYGLINESEAEKLSRSPKKFMSCVVQANSGNYGFNLPSKYSKANYYSLSKLEAELCLQKRFENNEKLAESIKKRLKSSYVSVTFGQNGSIINTERNQWKMPALSKYIKDAIGCGDVYFALSSLALAVDRHPKIALLAGSIGAAIMAQRFCNEKPVSKEDFLTVAEIIV